MSKRIAGIAKVFAAAVIFISAGLLFAENGQADEFQQEVNDFSDPFAADFADPFSDPFTDEFDDPFSDPFSNDSDDFDDIFFQDTGITELDPETEEYTETYETFLISEALNWGGRFSGRIDLGWDWESYIDGLAWEDASGSASPSASASLYFDARPELGYRVFGKFFIETQAGGFGALGDLGLDLSAVNFTDNEDGSISFSTNPDSDQDADNDSNENESDPTPLSLTIGVQELFADFQHDDRLFFRFGKSFVKWGVGYFFSPADVINLDSIDAEDPTADRQGPLNFRIQYPSGINNTYFYILADQIAEPEDISFAGKYEWVTGNSEIGLGALYSINGVPKLMTTLSSSVGEVRIFGESVLSYGSSRVFIAESKVQPEFDADAAESEKYTALDTFTIDSLPLFSATAGFSYNRSDPNIFIVGQYFFNGEGYASNPIIDSENGKTLLDAAAFLLLNPDANGLAKPENEQPDDYKEPPALGFGDISNFGQHYGALALSWNEIAETDLSANLFWIGNLTDGSGIISPTLSWSIIDRLSASAGVRMTYGASGTEFADPAGLFAQDPEDNPQDPTFSLTLQFSIGGGSF